MESAQEPQLPIVVAAFIMMHAGIDPTEYSTEKKDTVTKCKKRSIPHGIPSGLGDDSLDTDNYYEPHCYEYKLTASVLEAGKHLYAPSILGNSYYDHKNTNVFLENMNQRYDKATTKNPDYISYCLEEIKNFEEGHVQGMRQLNDESTGSQYDRQQQLERGEAIVHKSRVLWNKHTHYITEKTYSIVYNDDPINSIMLYCPQYRLSSSAKDAGVVTAELKKVESYNEYGCEVIFEPNSNTCSIQFNARKCINYIPFKNIVNMIDNVLKSILPQGVSKYELSIFDFTCSEVEFLNHPNKEETPEYISYNKEHNTMLYGTRPTEQDSTFQRQKMSLPFAEPDLESPHCHHHLLRSYFRLEEGPSITPSPQRASSYIKVHLDVGIITFVDSDLTVELVSDSLDPCDCLQGSGAGVDKVEDADGGSRRRRPRRTIKKVSLRNRRRTKVRSKRTKRQRKTKSKR